MNNIIKEKKLDERLSGSANFFFTEWLTDDFLSKVEGDPILSKGFSDPIMMQYLNLLQTNPKQAFATAQGNPKVRNRLWIKFPNIQTIR